MGIRLYVSVAWLSTALSGLACGNDNSALDRIAKQRRSIGEAIDAYVTHEAIPGMSVAVAYEGNIVFSEAYGWSNVEQGVVVTQDTRFRLASVSKLFTAAAIAKLAEEKRLDLDAPIQKYVPAFPEKRWPVTVRQIAGHLGGIRGYEAKDFADGKDVFKKRFDSTLEALQIFADDPLKFEPGTNYKYSTYGYTLLTAAIESVTGEAYEDYLHQAILSPLGIESVVADRPEAILTNRTNFYEFTEQRAVKHADYLRSDFRFGGGGLLGTAEDLVRFGSAHLQPSLFKSDTLQQVLMTPQVMRTGATANVGLAWRIGTDEEYGQVLHHSGALPGGRSVLMVWKDHKLVVAALSNATDRPYYAEEFAYVLSSLFLSIVDGAEAITPVNGSQRIELLVFESDEGAASRALAIPSNSSLGWIETPPHIASEMDKRRLPPSSELPALIAVIGLDEGYTAVFGSAIGLHRMDLDSDGRNGVFIELGNKFLWDKKQHPFRVDNLLPK